MSRDYQASDWKPGAAAVIGWTSTSGEERATCCNDGWHTESGATPTHESITSARPLVVIDPEDREQVERLRDETLRALRDHIGNRAVDECAFTEADLANAMQAALREFANPTPPKPAEPMGLGAVVVDAEGARWVRTGDRYPWLHVDVDVQGDDYADSCYYSDITVVRVLSEGVTE